MMLTEAVDFLQRQYGVGASDPIPAGAQRRKSEKGKPPNRKPSPTSSISRESKGWEILVISDGSKDKTVETALRFARGLGESSTSIRVVSLLKNRGKGGAVTHGMRHVRGEYAIFADADGASRFEDLGKLLRASQKIEDASGRSVAVGSRAHLVGSEAVVKVPSPFRSSIYHHDTHPNFFSAPFSVTFSCILSISSSDSSLLPPRPRSAIRNAASNYSRGPLSLTSSLTCTPKAGSSTSSC